MCATKNMRDAQNFIGNLTTGEGTALDRDEDLDDLDTPLVEVLRCLLDFGRCALELKDQEKVFGAKP